MAVYAIMTADLLTVVDVLTTTDVMPTSPPAIDITNANPQPGIGWTTPDGGVTWVTPAPSSPIANQASLLQKAANAIANNVTFLGLTTPTNAQVLAQVQALTRQVDALIRVVANQLTDTSGT